MGILFEIVKIVIDAALLPAWFLPLFHETAYLPNQISETGEVVLIDRIRHTYSMAQNISACYPPLLIFLSLALTVASIVAAVVSLIRCGSTAARTVSHVLFALSLLVFVLLLFLAATVHREY